MKKILTLLFITVLSYPLWAQTYSIKGIVREKNTSEPIVGANIVLKGTTLSTASDANGAFILKKVPSGKYELTASFVGMKRVSQIIALSGDVSAIVFEMEESSQNLGEVVVTATGTHHSLKNVPVQTEVISKQDIKNIAPRSFEEMTMSISPSFDYSPGAMGSFTKLNGLDNNFFVILIDGKRMYGDIGGQNETGRISPDNIEKVEIVKGASSALYGSDAMAGVINIITKKNKNKVNFESTSRVGKYYDCQQSNSLNLNVGKFSSNTQFAHKQTDGYQLSTLEYIDLKKNKNTKPTDRKAVNMFYDNSLSQKFSYSITPNINVYAQGSWYEKEIQQPQTVAAYNFFYKDLSGSAGIKYKISNRSNITLDASSDNFWYYYKYNQDYENKKTKEKYTKDQKVLNTKQTLNNYNLKAVTAICKQHLLSTGAEIAQEKMDSDRVKNGNAEVYTIALYAQDEYMPLKNLTIVAGARFFNHKTFGNSITPKLSALYNIKDFNFRASFAQGFKTPTLKELYFEYQKGGTLYLGNENLNPQKSDYYSASVEYISGGVTASVTGYVNQLKNLIDYIDGPQPTAEQKKQGVKNIRIHENIAKAQTQGVDFLVNAYMGYGFTVGGGYSFVDAKNKTEDIRLEGVAENYGTAMLNYKYNIKNYILNANVNGRIQDEKFFKNYGNAKAYNLWKLTTTHTYLFMPGLYAEATVGIDNIFNYVDDTPYGAHYGTLSPGRNVFGALKFVFTR